MDFPEDIYSTRILEVVASMPEMGVLDKAEGSGLKQSKLCGSKVHVDVNLDEEGKISDYGHQIEACLLGQASAALMARNAVGLTRADVASVRDKMNAMLKEDGPAPDGIWADLDVLYPVKDYKPRHTSMTLVFEATLEAMDKAAQAKGLDLETQQVEMSS